MIDPFIKKLLIESSTNLKSSWAIVRNGAVAEFCITNDDDDPKQYFDKETNNLFVQTHRATLKLNLNENIIPIVAETASYRCSSWSQSVYLSAPKNGSKMSNHDVLTHVSKWNKCDQDGDLWILD